MALRTYSLPQITRVGAEFPDDDKDSRPPDAGIRATTDIMREGMAFFGRAMEACVAASGLNIVLGGSNPDVARPPQKISGLNGQELAALQNLSSAASKTSGESKPDDKKSEPKAQDTNPAPPQPDDKSPSTTADTTPTTPDWNEPPPAATTDDKTPPPSGNNTPPVKAPDNEGKNGEDGDYQSELPDDDGIDNDPPPTPPARKTDVPE